MALLEIILISVNVGLQFGVVVAERQADQE